MSNNVQRMRVSALSTFAALLFSISQNKRGRQLPAQKMLLSDILFMLSLFFQEGMDFDIVNEIRSDKMTDCNPR